MIDAAQRSSPDAIELDDECPNCGYCRIRAVAQCRPDCGAKAYVERAIASYAGDPADNQFQKGYLAALEVVRDEAFTDDAEQPEDRYVHIDNVVYHLDDIEVDAAGKCAWTEVANALTHIKLCVERRTPPVTSTQSRIAED